MNKQTKRHHTIDMLFVIALFCTFAVSATLLIAYGADTYKRTLHSFDEHFTVSTATSYLKQKVRQHDYPDGISISSFGDGDSLLLYDTYQEKVYITYIYRYNGFIKELFVAEDTKPNPDAGHNIIEARNLNISFPQSNIIWIGLGDMSDSYSEFTLYLHSNTY